MTQRTRTDFIAVHCSATKPSMDIGVEEIRAWHIARKMDDVGYAWVIRRDGTLEKGRDEDAIGAHVVNYNARSVGICLAGGVAEHDVDVAENNFTPAQFATLKTLLLRMTKKYPRAKVQGHRDFPKVSKACPSFDVATWLREVGL